MSKLTRLACFVCCAALLLPLASFAAPADAPAPTFVRGHLGFVDATGPVDPNGIQTDAHNFRLSVLAFARNFSAQSLDAAGLEDFSVLRTRTDEQGRHHVRLGQQIAGLPVDGAQLVVHADSVTGAVFAVNGEFASSAGVATAPVMGPRAAFEVALADLGVRAERGKARLAYVLGPDGQAVLSWKALVEWVDAEGPHADWMYADSSHGTLVASHPTIHHTKSWQTHDARNRTRLPGTLLCTDGQSCGDSAAQAAHDNASATYDYYASRFGRDSLDGNGMTMTSTVHYSRNYNNAFWNGSQMVYGDGDGSVFVPLSLSLDVVAHELTHGVTDFESDLVYQNESGALNESMSDIFGAAVEAAVDGGITADTWKIGEDIYTPNTPGDALRYMNNPTIDGSSTDYYPERYTGSSDNGGVHWNSGIPNLAFYLMSVGGTHPRGKTTVSVPAIGIETAAAIFYDAQVNYLTPSSTMEAARAATALSAQNLFGTATADAVHQAWCAVGVPGCPDGGGGGGDGGGDPNCTPGSGTVTNLSGKRNAELVYTIDVPACASVFTVSMSGGSGDADLFVRYGAAPTTSAYDCRPFLSGNNETCTFANPQGGTWYMMVRGYRSFSGVTLDASFQ